MAKRTIATEKPIKITNFTRKSRLDETARPQDNFFNYVNRKWIKANPIPDSKRRWGTFNVLHHEAQLAMKKIYEGLQGKQFKAGTVQQQTKDFYYTGINSSKFESKHLEIIASYLTKIDNSENLSQLSATIGELQALGISAPWRTVIDADDKDSNVHILRFRQGGLTLPDRDYYLSNDAKMRHLRNAYKLHLEKVHKHIPQLAASAKKFSSTVFSMEKSLAKIARSQAELRDVEANYNKTTFKKLTKTYDSLDWVAFAKALGWKYDDKITVDQPEFFTFINEQAAKLPLENWKIYLKWHLVVEYYSFISERFAKLKFEFFGKELSGTKKLLPAWERVAMVLDMCMGENVGKLYVKEHFSQQSKDEVLRMIEDLRAAYKHRITNLDWMSATAKKEALKKLASFKVLIGYPEKWRDFSKLKVVRSSYLENIMTAQQFDYAHWLAKLHKPVSRDEWFMNPQTVNAYHDFNRRVICFPAAILQPPFFEPGAPVAVNYGAIGAVIGHELTHGFDDEGSKFDSEGNAKPWQSKEDRKAFDKRAKLIIDHADSFEVLPGLNMRGKLVIGEAIADLGGLEIAHEAYLNRLARDGVKPTLNNEKLFFISFAIGECANTRTETRRQVALSDPHPDERFRVNGTLPHCDAFYKAFSVAETDKLYRAPQKRAKIW